MLTIPCFIFRAENLKSRGSFMMQRIRESIPALGHAGTRGKGIMSKVSYRLFKVILKYLKSQYNNLFNLIIKVCALKG